MNANHRVMKMLAAALLSGGIAVAGLGLSSATANAFNPQPDPPGRHLVALIHRLENPGVRVGFNPQPDPPGRQIRALIHRLESLGSRRIGAMT